MKGDFTRVTFRPDKHYDGVRMQQGRVQLDADFNEEAEIREYLDATEAIDVIGPCGVPKTGGGFAIGVTSDGRDLTISPGRIYVDGLLCENPDATVDVSASSETDSTVTVDRLRVAGRTFAEDAVVELLDGSTSLGTATISAVDKATRTLTLSGAQVAPFLQSTGGRRLRLATTYSGQPYWPEPEPLDPATTAPRKDLVYLDVWQRHVTAVEDPDLLEPALGGVDTGTRVQTVWQVRVLPNVGEIGCEDPVAGWPPTTSGGLLSNDAVPGSAQDDPCVVPQAGGYTGIENRLYRVEVHQGTEVGKTETFKWSRDNGSLAFPIDEFVNGGGPAKDIRLHRLGRDETLGLRKNDWVEYVDDKSELAGLPGQLVQIEDVDELERVVTLSDAIGPEDASLHPKLRRWDQPSDGIAIAAGTSFNLESGIEVEFGGGDFQSGDYWLFAARTATGEIEHLTEAPPRGIRHHYCRLALVTWEEQTTSDGTSTATCVLSSVPADCRVPFPPLTDICAEDVCFDNTLCGLTDVETVQDALDRMCGEQDLRFHKKHLHGWGIVCGLQVQCVGEACPDVKVLHGYAIDCEGRDIRVREDERIGVLDLIRKSTSSSPSAFDTSAAVSGATTVVDGAYSLYLALDNDLRHTFKVEPYERAKEPLNGLLNGTLLWDVWEECIQNLVQFYHDQFTVPADGSSTELVSPAQKRLTTFLNLLIQLYDSEGQYVFLSKREHDILLAFYDELRKLLTSSTFCAMFQGARPFPDYPTEWDPMPTTAFGLALHSRLRTDPKGERGFTCGHENEIQVYDLAKDELVEVLVFPAGPDVEVQDVATLGGDLYAIATQDGNTHFAVAEYKASQPLGQRYTWRSAQVTCNVKLLSLGMSPKEPGTVYAVGGRDLWKIEPDGQSPAWTSVATFSKNATGPLVIVGEAAYALIGASGGPYDSLVRQPLSGGGLEEIGLAHTPTGVEEALSGTDDLAVAFGSGLETVGVVVDSPSGDAKWLLLYDFTKVAHDAHLIVKAFDYTETRVVWDGDTETMLVSSADSHRLTPVTLDGTIQTDSNGGAYRHPVQIGPMSLAASAGRIHALNQLSRTISSIESKDVPATPEFDIEQLVDYRNDVLAAFTDLLGGFIQYLKDCICDHFLVDCPTCTGKEKLYLAAVEIKNGDVYHVCNFSKRRYVKSFPTVEYWLSAVPVLPLIHYVIEQVCCAVLPPRFGKFDPKRRKGKRRPVQVGRTVGAISHMQRTIPHVRRQARSTIAGGRQTGLAWIQSHLFGEPPVTSTITEVASPAAGTPELDSTAHEASAVMVAPAEAPPPALAAEVKALRGEVKRLSDLQARGFASRDKKIARLRTTVDRLQEESPPG